MGLFPCYWKGNPRGVYGQVYFEKDPQVLSVVRRGLRITTVDNLISALPLITIYVLRIPKLNSLNSKPSIVNPLAKSCWRQYLKCTNFFPSPLLPPQFKLLSSLPQSPANAHCYYSWPSFKIHSVHKCQSDLSNNVSYIISLPTVFK